MVYGSKTEMREVGGRSGVQFGKIGGWGVKDGTILVGRWVLGGGKEGWGAQEREGMHGEVVGREMFTGLGHQLNPWQMNPIMGKGV